MAESRKAALVVENNKLVGIFGFKDMMNRVISKELPLEETEISNVMTKNPEVVSPDITVLEALQIMHENKFLTLPVCEENGSVLGLVNVLDLIYGCGGAEGWRSIFTTTLEMDDLSETASHFSEPSRGVAGSLQRKASKDDKTVLQLRPKKAVVCSSEDSILEVVKKLSSFRSHAAVLIDPDGHMNGVFTDTDVTRRVTAKGPSQHDDFVCYDKICKISGAF
jgi:signal-transduction protein with cAMP-binding, CBS, and nucleotidyltransferase domain